MQNRVPVVTWIVDTWMVSGLTLGLVLALAIGTHSPLATADESQPTDTPPESAPSLAAEVDFVRDVKPILDNSCVECHGPDKQKGKLRLDQPPAEDSPLLAAGDPHGSELFQRVTLPKDDLDFMPEGGDPLSPKQLATLRRWIEQGAVWPASAPNPVAPSFWELPPLSPKQREAGATALDRAREVGAVALAISRDQWAHEVNFSLLGKRADDDVVMAIQGLEPSLVWLNLSRTAISDASLAEIGKFSQLRKLNLAGTAISDAGLVHLRGLQHLQVLNLYGTAIGDAGLIPLTQLSKLQKLYLWQTQVSDAGVAALAQLLPHLQINRGSELKPPAPEIVVAQSLPDCCQRAKDAGNSCDHPCCVAAAKEGKICEKCSSGR